MMRSTWDLSASFVSIAVPLAFFLPVILSRRPDKLRVVMIVVKAWSVVSKCFRDICVAVCSAFISVAKLFSTTQPATPQRPSSEARLKQRRKNVRPVMAGPASTGGPPEASCGDAPEESAEQPQAPLSKAVQPPAKAKTRRRNSKQSPSSDFQRAEFTLTSDLEEHSPQARCSVDDTQSGQTGTNASDDNACPVRPLTTNDCNGELQEEKTSDPAEEDGWIKVDKRQSPKKPTKPEGKQQQQQEQHAPKERPSAEPEADPALQQKHVDDVLKYWGHTMAATSSDSDSSAGKVAAKPARAKQGRAGGKEAGRQSPVWGRAKKAKETACTDDQEGDADWLAEHPPPVVAAGSEWSGGGGNGPLKADQKASGFQWSAFCSEFLARSSTVGSTHDLSDNDSEGAGSACLDTSSEGSAPDSVGSALDSSVDHSSDSQSSGECAVEPEPAGCFNETVGAFLYPLVCEELWNIDQRAAHLAQKVTGMLLEQAASDGEEDHDAVARLGNSEHLHHLVLEAVSLLAEHNLLEQTTPPPPPSEETALDDALSDGWEGREDLLMALSEYKARRGLVNGFLALRGSAAARREAAAHGAERMTVLGALAKAVVGHVREQVAEEEAAHQKAARVAELYAAKRAAARVAVQQVTATASLLAARGAVTNCPEQPHAAVFANPSVAVPSWLAV